MSSPWPSAVALGPCFRYVCCGLRQQRTIPPPARPRGQDCSSCSVLTFTLFPERGILEGLGGSTPATRCPPCHPARSGPGQRPAGERPEHSLAPLAGPPGAVLPQRQPDGRAAGGRRHPGLRGHGPQGPGAGPEKRRLPARVQPVARPAARHPQQGERARSQHVVWGCEGRGSPSFWGEASSAAASLPPESPAGCTSPQTPLLSRVQQTWETLLKRGSRIE